MPVPTNKKELIFAIESSYLKLRTYLALVPNELTTQKELAGHAKGTSMNVLNLVSYLIGWGELVLKWNREKDRGVDIDFPETGYKWNELGLLAQKFYVDYESFAYRELLSKLDETIADILLLIQAQENNDLYEKTWYGKWTKGRMIQLNTVSPYKNSRTRLRKWLKSKKQPL